MSTVRVVKVGGINRLVAAGLAVVWAAAGVIGVIAAFRHRHALAGVAAVFASSYAAAWVLVASRARLVSWKELLRPWRALLAAYGGQSADRASLSIWLCDD